MSYLHVYGFLKKKFDSKDKISEQTIVKLDFIVNETFFGLLKRINVRIKDPEDRFINPTVIINGSQLIPDESRVGLFSTGMLLHEASEFLKNRLYL